MSSSTPCQDGSGGGGGAEVKQRRWWRRAIAIDGEEAKRQMCFAVPMILTNMSYYAISVISVMFVGHLGDLELASSTLANSWSSVTCIALMADPMVTDQDGLAGESPAPWDADKHFLMRCRWSPPDLRGCLIDLALNTNYSPTGLSGALETLCGQGYGAQLYRMLGVYLQASIIMSLFFSILVSILWYYTEPILILLHQKPQVSKMAAVYLKYLIPGIFSYGFIQCILRFLQTQTVVIPLVLCSVIPLSLHVGIAYLLVHVLDLGFKGAPLAASISLWISFLMLALYVNYSKKFKHTWEGLSMEAFQYVIPNMKLAIPSAVMVCLEYWAFELLVLLAGLMRNSEYSTSLIAMCVNTETIAYMITYGFSAVVSTRVSNEMGAGNTEKAKNAVSVTLKLSIFLALTIVLLLNFVHDIWANLFSSSPVIIRGFAYMTPLLTVSILFDSAQGVLSGVARGCGWQHIAAWTNLIAFYGIGMPFAILFGFKLKLRDKGLWIGLICGLFCQACTLLVITLRTKWTKLDLSVRDNQDRVVV